MAGGDGLAPVPAPGSESVGGVLESLILHPLDAFAELTSEFEELGLFRLVLFVRPPVCSGEKSVQPGRPPIFRIHEVRHVTRWRLGGVYTRGFLVRAQLGGGASQSVGVEERHGDAGQPPLLGSCGLSPLMGPFFRR